MDTVVLLNVVYQFVCFSTPYLPTALTKTHIYHSHNICHLVSSLANVSSIIVLRCVLNCKLRTVHKMSVD